MAISVFIRILESNNEREIDMKVQKQSQKDLDRIKEIRTNQKLIKEKRTELREQLAVLNEQDQMLWRKETEIENELMKLLYGDDLVILKK